MSEVWEDLEQWRRGDRVSDPASRAVCELRHVVARLVADIELGCQSKGRSMAELLAAGVQRATRLDGPAFADWDMPAAEWVDVTAGRPGWLEPLAEVLNGLGWAWPQPASEALAAVWIAVIEGRREALDLSATGIPKQTWSSLALLVGGSIARCDPAKAWPGVMYLCAVDGWAAVDVCDEVRRLCRMAVAGRCARTRRTSGLAS